MTRDAKQMRWFALAGSAFIAAVVGSTLILPDAPNDPVWRGLMGISTYTLITGLVSKDDGRKGHTTTRAIGAWVLFSAVTTSLGTLSLAGQFGMIPVYLPLALLVPVLLAALASVVATGYLATLWWLEWQDDA